MEYLHHPDAEDDRRQLLRDWQLFLKPDRVRQESMRAGLRAADTASDAPFQSVPWLFASGLRAKVCLPVRNFNVLLIRLLTKET